MKTYCKHTVIDTDLVTKAYGRWCPSRVTIRSSIFLRARRALHQFDAHPSLRRARRTCAYLGWIVPSDSRKFVASSDAIRIQKAARAVIAENERPTPC